MTELNDVFDRLRGAKAVAPFDAVRGHLQQQELTRRVELLEQRHKRLNEQVYDLFDVVLHRETGRPPDPETIRRIMRANK